MEKKHSPGPSDSRWMLVPRQPGPVGDSKQAHQLTHTERRIRSDRRLVHDRRQLIRFEDDRRDGRERRMDADPWAFP